MGRHAARWAPYLERGDMVVFGPVLTDEYPFGLAVAEPGDEQPLQDFASSNAKSAGSTLSRRPGRSNGRT